MPRRSRYPAGKTTSQARGRRSSRVKPPLTRSSVPVNSSQAVPRSSVPSAPISSDTIRESLAVPSYIIRELKMTGIITAAMIVILVILAIVL